MLIKQLRRNISRELTSKTFVEKQCMIIGKLTVSPSIRMELQDQTKRCSVCSTKENKFNLLNLRINIEISIDTSILITNQWPMQ